jgi:Zn-dependent protease
MLLNHIGMPYRRASSAMLHWSKSFQRGVSRNTSYQYTSSYIKFNNYYTFRTPSPNTFAHCNDKAKYSHLPKCVSTIHVRPYSSGKPPKRPKLNPSRLSGLGAVSSLAFLSLTKSKSILVALKLTKFASLGSMLVTVGAYTTIYGLPFASGMVGLILVHESGHALVMRKLKIPFSPMVFIPFMGAAIAAKKHPKNAYDDALIALGGPALGTIGAGAVWSAGMLTGSQLCFALADFGFMINLFNLIPVGMLDGGRIGNALSPYTGVAGVGLAGSMIYTGAVANPIFYLITLAGGYQSGMRLWNERKGIVNTSLPKNFYQITQRERMVIGGSYVGLISLLFSAMALNENYKKPPEQVRYDMEQRASGASIVDGAIHGDY